MSAFREAPANSSRESSIEPVRKEVPGKRSIDATPLKTRELRDAREPELFKFFAGDTQVKPYLGRAQSLN